MYRLSSNCRFRAVPGVSDVGVVMSWMWERILLSEIFLYSRSSESRVVSRTVHSISGLYFAVGLYGPWTEAEAPLGEVDESSCFSWPRAAEPVRLVEGNGLTCGTLLLSTVHGILRETLSIIVVRKSVLCLLLLRDRLCEVDRGLGIKKRDE